MTRRGSTRTLGPGVKGHLWLDAPAHASPSCSHLLKPPRVPGEDQAGGWGEGKERATGETPTSHLGGIRNKGGREGGSEPFFLKEDTKARSCASRGELGQSRACAASKTALATAAGEPGSCSDQGMWLLALIFTFHNSATENFRFEVEGLGLQAQLSE